MAFFNLPIVARLLAYFRNRRGGKVDRMKTPQQLSRQAIEEFKAIYREEFGETLSDEKVQEMALRLLRFFGILTEPAPGDTPDKTTSPQRPR